MLNGTEVNIRTVPLGMWRRPNDLTDRNFTRTYFKWYLSCISFHNVFCRAYEFNVLFLLDWLPTNARKLSLTLL